jgi:hypothetical protein
LPDFVYSIYSASFASFLTSVHSLFEPSSYKEAILDPLWKKAMAEELAALHKTNTWDIVPLPPGKRAIGSRWVYKIKTKSDGSVERYKARLVAKGFSQQYGMDYEETFAPVAKMTTIRTLIAVASVRQWNISQMDVKNAFLNGDLQEEVYMVPPLGVSHNQGEVCKLRKALYGLKQAPRAWYERLSIFLLENGFEKGHVDNTLFRKTLKTDILIVQIYVDDIIFGSTNASLCKSFSKLMQDEFEMSMMGELTFFLGIQINQRKEGVYVHQTKYTKDLLKKFGLEDCKPMTTPMHPTSSLLKEESEGKVDQKLYRGMIGSLLYLTASRPDILFSVDVQLHSINPRSTRT